MIENLPDLSICIPTYEPDLGQLHELLTSVSESAQGLHYEIIISDDCSSNSGEARALAAQFEKMRFTQHSSRLGMVKNWNSCAGQARGNYVVMPGQDDLFAKDGLRNSFVAAIESQADLVFNQLAYVDESTTVRPSPRRGMRVHDQGFRELLTRSKGPDLVAIALTCGNVLGDPCHVLVSRRALEDASAFNLRYEHAYDLELWCRLLVSGARFSFLHTNIMAHRRIHTSNATRAHVRSGATHRDRVRLFEDFLPATASARLRARSATRLYVHWMFDFVAGNRSKWPRLNSVRLPWSVWAGVVPAALLEELGLKDYQPLVEASIGDSDD